MNVNLAVGDNIRRSLQDDIDDNMEVMQSERVVLVAPPDAAMTGVYQVWHQGDGAWVWVDEEGVEHRRNCPLDEDDI